MPAFEHKHLPRWARELLRFLPARSGFVLHGNIQDYHVYPLDPAGPGEPPPGEPPSAGEPPWLLLDLEAYLYRLLREQGYENIVYYDLVDGFRVRDNGETLEKFRRLAGAVSPAREQATPTREQAAPTPDRWAVPPSRAMDLVRAAVATGGGSVAVVVNLASRLTGEPESLSEGEREVFARIWKAIREAVQVRREGRLLRNLVILVADKANDLPAWLYLENPFAKLIQVERPDTAGRRRYIDRYLSDFHSGSELAPAEQEKAKRAFTDLTESMTNADLEALRLVGMEVGVPASDMKSLLDLYRYGVRESPWNEVDAKRLAEAETRLRARVRGQEPAIRQTLDILKRARVGLAGVQQSARSNRPKGVLFFAGPTGVGKTELAKGLAELLFSDDQAYVRFDMSEFGQEHADQRLLGAPPGYVGYEAGGQLTEAIRRRPFSIVLFDEIEKAHPSLFDKFLQIIDDGRLTDGRGETVHFSEAVLIFTSNLGQSGSGGPSAGSFAGEPTAEPAGADPGMDYPTVQSTVLRAIRRFFVDKLHRPEILNRFGENFVVFDYIRPEIAPLILDKVLANVTERLAATRNLRLELTSEVRADLLRRSCERLEFGGRGIGNVVEKVLVNPLARYVFDGDVNGPGRLTVEAIAESADGQINLTCRRGDE